jgi:hypothetical protein
MRAAGESAASLVAETMALVVRTVLVVTAIGMGLELPFALPLPGRSRKAPPPRVRTSGPASIPLPS